MTVVVPSGKVAPLAGVQLTCEVRSPSSRSLAVTVNETAAPALLVASTTMSLGSTSVGAVFVTAQGANATCTVTSAPVPALSLAVPVDTILDTGTVKLEVPEPVALALEIVSVTCFVVEAGGS